jgi:hypothetical protein
MLSLFSSSSSYATSVCTLIGPSPFVHIESGTWRLPPLHPFLQVVLLVNLGGPTLRR